MRLDNYTYSLQVYMHCWKISTLICNDNITQLISVRRFDIFPAGVFAALGVEPLKHSTSVQQNDVARKHFMRLKDNSRKQMH